MTTPEQHTKHAVIQPTSISKEQPIHFLPQKKNSDSPKQFHGLTIPPPLSLYIHLPWCIRKCPYCDFNSHEASKDFEKEASHYVDALLLDLELSLPSIWGRKIHTIFLGGGTPSLFSAELIERLLTQIHTLLPINPGAEITMEANPGTFEQAKFRDFKAAGINRLSLGVQSFNDTALKSLGRVHDKNQAIEAAQFARSLFDNINLDIMYALPDQTHVEAMADIEQAILLQPDHISLYHLTLEPNTYFHRHPPTLPNDDIADLMFENLSAALNTAGYGRYEVSAYAKPGQRAQHNLNYWQFGDYLGIGAGAHSKLSFHDKIERQIRHKQPKAYLQSLSALHEKTQAFHPAIQHTEILESTQLPFEFMLNSLRLIDGVETGLFTERTGLPLSTILDNCSKAEQKQLMPNPLKIGVLKPTELGIRFLNDLQVLFL